MSKSGNCRRHDLKKVVIKGIWNKQKKLIKTLSLSWTCHKTILVQLSYASLSLVSPKPSFSDAAEYLQSLSALLITTFVVWETALLIPYELAVWKCYLKSTYLNCLYNTGIVLLIYPAHTSLWQHGHLCSSGDPYKACSHFSYS